MAGSIECSPVCSDDKYVELYCIPFLGGFGWVFPLRDTYNIGVGCWACLSHKLYDYYFDFAENILKNKNIKGIVSKPQGSFIPVGGLLRNLGNDYIIAAGDSGGFVDAFSGEGIYYAIKSGQIAAGEIVKSLSDNEYPLYLQYKRECGREFNKSFYYSIFKVLLSGKKKTITADRKKAEHLMNQIMAFMLNGHWHS